MTESEQSYLVTPEFARGYLLGLGLPEREWQACLEQRRLSHMARSLIKVAQGDERDLLDIYNEDRLVDDEPPASRTLLQAICTDSDDVVTYLGTLEPTLHKTT
jgi:hypothetical protein